MTKHRRLRIRWFNSLDCELAQVTCFNERDAAIQLALMIKDAGGEIAAGDHFRIDDCGEEIRQRHAAGGDEFNDEIPS